MIEVPDLREQAAVIVDEYARGRTKLMPWELELPCNKECPRRLVDCAMVKTGLGVEERKLNS